MLRNGIFLSPPNGPEKPDLSFIWTFAATWSKVFKIGAAAFAGADVINRLRRDVPRGGNSVNRREAVKEYKKTIQPMGIVQVKNLTNHRVYLKASGNTPGTINGIRFQLKMGNFPLCPELTRDWNELGGQNFVIDVLDELKPVVDPEHDYVDDLKELEKMWKEQIVNTYE